MPGFLWLTSDVCLQISRFPFLPLFLIPLLPLLPSFVHVRLLNISLSLSLSLSLSITYLFSQYSHFYHIAKFVAEFKCVSAFPFFSPFCPSLILSIPHSVHPSFSFSLSFPLFSSLMHVYCLSRSPSLHFHS